MTMLHATRPETDRMTEADPVTETLRPTAEPRPISEVRGVVDNATTNRVYGWVWDASYPTLRVPLELRRAGEVIATTIADHARPDLAANGIGDGCHAFEFALLPEWFNRSRELTVTALGGDGRAYPVPVRLHQAEPVPAPENLQRAVEAVAAEQQAIRAEQAELRAQAARLPDAEAVAAVARSAEAVSRRLDELELWIARLDSRLAQAPEAGAAPAKGGIDVWQAVLITVLVGTVSAAIAAVFATFGS